MCVLSSFAAPEGLESTRALAFLILFQNDLDICCKELLCMAIRVAKWGIALAKSPLFLDPRGRGRGRGQLLDKHWGITGKGTRYTLGDFLGIFPEDYEQVEDSFVFPDIPRST